jgi:hypothetical protein
MKETLKIKFLQSIAGRADERYDLPREWSFAPGETAIINKTLALLWIESGVAELVAEEKKADEKKK